jgi:hypothetical protein
MEVLLQRGNERGNFCVAISLARKDRGVSRFLI